MEWSIAALDTLFFRGTTPFVAGESVFLESQFPPTPRTVQGMVRTALLETHCQDLALFARNGCGRCPVRDDCTVQVVVGTPRGGIGTLRLTGPYLLQEGVDHQGRLYPAPGDLRREPLARLTPGPVVLCDQGTVHLPWQAETASDPGPPADWITEAGLRAYLDGSLPESDQLLATGDLVDAEPRVGLARDGGTRAAREGMLYSIAPLRPRDGLRLGVRLDGVDDALAQAALGTRRFGGEGRLVGLEQRQGPDLLGPTAALRAELERTGRLRLMLLQPADLEGGWLPKDFERTATPSETSWRGQIDGVDLTIVVSCGGPPVVIGGWDLAENQPLAPRRCVAAGTVYYVRLEQPADAERALSVLSNARIGRDTALGFGQLCVGAWPEPLPGGES